MRRSRNARGLAIYFFGASERPEVLDLGVNALAIGRDTGIAVNHPILMHPVCTPEKESNFLNQGLVQNSENFMRRAESTA
jgi:hypothetical protein